MPRRSYDHYCAVARALDHLGERWALLIVRELLAGPRRYSDLLADLPGISTDVLAARLREMEGDGLVTRAHGGLRSYQLTEAGRAVAPVLDALADWGLDRLRERAPGDAVRAHWLAAPLTRRLGAEVLLNLDGSAPADGTVLPTSAVLTTSAETAAAIAAGRISLRAAVDGGEAKLEGPDRPPHVDLGEHAG